MIVSDFLLSLRIQNPPDRVGSTVSIPSPSPSTLGLQQGHEAWDHQQNMDAGRGSSWCCYGVWILTWLGTGAAACQCKLWQPGGWGERFIEQQWRLSSKRTKPSSSTSWKNESGVQFWTNNVSGKRSSFFGGVRCCTTALSTARHVEAVANKDIEERPDAILATIHRCQQTLKELRQEEVNYHIQYFQRSTAYCCSARSSQGTDRNIGEIPFLGNMWILRVSSHRKRPRKDSVCWHVCLELGL